MMQKQFYLIILFKDIFFQQDLKKDLKKKKNDSNNLKAKQE